MPHYTLDGNEAVARIAYALSEAAPIYPITPSSSMGEWFDEWSSQKKPNLWGHVPRAIELQSEAGASGTLHGLLSTGVLATTFTASQGLLLMIPNMYKIAGELLPAVMHVSARSLSYQALSIFGDFSDIMAVRQTGWALLSSGSVQEAHDMALVSHVTTLRARIPFVHFFEGFRVSHEVSKIDLISDDTLRALVDENAIRAHRNRALSPEHPVMRGVAQNPDVYFQGREASNPFYAAVPGIVQETMDLLAQLTGRAYHLVDYTGSEEPDRVIILMGAGAQTVRETCRYLNDRAEKVGVIQIRLYRPFPSAQFVSALPKSVKAIAVLDRTKESGGVGDPLYLDIVTALAEAQKEGRTSISPRVIGGRYGLSSKEFTPAMVKAIFDELKKPVPKNHFTVGICDDVSHSSLEYDPSFLTESPEVIRALFFGLGSDGTVGANKNSIKIIGEETANYAQGYFVYDSKKSGSRTISHLRFGPKPIEAPYLIQSASFIGVHHFPFVDQIDILEHAADGAILLLNTSYGPSEIWDHLPNSLEETILKKHIALYVIDANAVAQATGMGARINTIMQTCFFAISGVLPREEAIQKIKESIRKTYQKKGDAVVAKNFAAVDHTLAHLHPVVIPASISPLAHGKASVVSPLAPEFVQAFTATMIAGLGEELPVSAIPVDGTYPTGTAQWEKRNIATEVPDWDSALCIQCGRCSMICPHSVLRAKLYGADALKGSPEGFKSVPAKGKDCRYSLQVYVEDCTGCGLCHEVCPMKNASDPTKRAINLVPKGSVFEKEKANLAFFETLPADTASVNRGTVQGLQFIPPLFEFSGACGGCGETPYLKLVSQLFGDRMLIANATGCSSIYGGNLPTTPWTKNADGRGPAWANSLFEDNAEFGFGFQMAHEQLLEEAKTLLLQCQAKVGEPLAQGILQATDSKDDAVIAEQRQRLIALRKKLSALPDDPIARQLLPLVAHFVKPSTWMIGGDGWAYDIGYGGLDHVLASGRDVNVLVLDTEVYSNTGGQASKSTPLGAIAKFAASGKALPKKDLGMMMMTYGYIYVARIALGADFMQAIQAFKEAEAYPGPSLIIAYSHCIAHGIDMQNGVNQQKLAVQSGSWPLYRYNPQLAREGKAPLILDSKAPSVPLKEYLYNETRFKSLLSAHPDDAARFLEQLQRAVEERYQRLEKMTRL